MFPGNRVGQQESDDSSDAEEVAAQMAALSVVPPDAEPEVVPTPEEIAAREQKAAMSRSRQKQFYMALKQVFPGASRAEINAVRRILHTLYGIRDIEDESDRLGLKQHAPAPHELWYNIKSAVDAAPEIVAMPSDEARLQYVAYYREHINPGYVDVGMEPAAGGGAGGAGAPVVPMEIDPPSDALPVFAAMASAAHFGIPVEPDEAEESVSEEVGPNAGL